MKKKNVKSIHRKKEKASSKKRKCIGIAQLEEIYLQYIAPMPLGEWSSVRDLSQPSMLKRVSGKTGYSSAG